MWFLHLTENQVHCTSNTNHTLKRNPVLSFDFTANNAYGPFTSLVDLYKLQFHLQGILMYRASYGWEKSGATCGSAQNYAVHYHLIPSIEEGKAQEWMRWIHPASTCWSDLLFTTKLELRSIEFEAPQSVCIRLLALWSSQSACKMIAQHAQYKNPVNISICKIVGIRPHFVCKCGEGQIGHNGYHCLLNGEKHQIPLLTWCLAGVLSSCTTAEVGSALPAKPQCHVNQNLAEADETDKEITFLEGVRITESETHG